MANREHVEILAKKLEYMVRSNDWVALAELLKATMASVYIAPGCTWQGIGSAPPESPNEGDMYYDTLIQKVRIYVLPIGWVDCGQIPN
jgi:hypothetical protein